MAQAGDWGRFNGSFDVPEGPVNVTDVLTFEVVPIGDDAQFTEVIGG
jgi:hypothetical protein